MQAKTIDVYGIGNPLIDILITVRDNDLESLSIDKGIMQLIDLEKRGKILSFFEKSEKSYICGGSCPNTIIAGACLGLRSCLAGKVADDEFGTIYTSQLKKYKVMTELSVGNGATGSSIILISPDAERSMNTYLGANREFTKEDLHPHLIKQARYLYFTGYMWDTEVQKEAIKRAIQIAHSSKTQVIFDVADPFAVNRYKEDFLKLIKEEVDIVLANREEARILFNSHDIHTCLNEMAEDTQMAVLKNGGAGSCIYKKGEGLLEIPVNPVKAVDTTGAGDMYTAGLIYGLCRGYATEKTGRCASYLASQIVTKIGAQFSEKDIPQIRKALHKIDAVFPNT